MTRRLLTLVLLTGLAAVTALHAQAPAPAPAAAHAKAVTRLLIRRAMIIPGTGMPAYGPADILAENGQITRIGDAAAGKWPAADAVIDATGKYVMPGIVNTHMHWHEERVGPIPIQYERNLYLAAGVTTAREVGGNFEKTKQWRTESAAHTIVAPRIVLYPMLTDLVGASDPAPVTPDEWRALVRRAKDRGADGIKFIGPMDKDQTEAALDEAKKVGLPTTVHVAVGEATARDFVDGGVNCIEHFYGVPDSALDEPQNFPPDMNLWNEIHRFGRAGELYTQASLNPEKLSTLLDDMVARKVAWSPTFSTYEAARDLIKAQNLPWYKDYLHPSLEAYYVPSMTRHGTFWMLVVNGNPLENLRVMNPYGTDLMAYDGKIVSNYAGFVAPEDPKVSMVHGGGIEWTIKDGIPYHVPTLMREVKDMVGKARTARK